MLHVEHGDLYALCIGRTFQTCACVFCDISMSVRLLRIILEQKSESAHDCHRYIDIVIDHVSFSAIAIVSNDKKGEN